MSIEIKYIGVFVFLVLLQGIICSPPLQLKPQSGLFEEDEPPQEVLQLNGVRLPRHVYPLHYDLEIRPILNLPEDNPLQFTAPGKVTIRLRCDNATNSIILHAREIDIGHEDITLTNVGTDELLMMVSYTNDTSTSTYTMNFLTTLVAQQEYDLVIPFTSLVGNRLSGLYRSSYLDSTGTRKWLATTQFQKSSARLAFPCFDEPNFKSTFNITIGRHIEYHSLCNSPLRETIWIPGMLNWQYDIYERTVSMPTYLIAMVVSDFYFVEAPTGLSKHLVKTWGPTSITTNATAEFSARAAAQILTWFENYLDYDFQFPKLDSVAIPDFSAGAMENWALNTYRINFLIWFAGESTQFEQWRQAAVIAHEISHHWFGDLVTCDWWNDLRLNEISFASYMQIVGATAALTQHGIMDRYTIDMIQIAMDVDAGPNTEPVHSTVLDQVVNQNPRIIYEKASALIRMMQGFLTEGTFINGIRTYLKKYEYANVIQDNLFTELQAQALIDGTSSNFAPFTVKDIMDSWTLKSGFPLVRVGRTSQSLIYLSQEHFLNEDQRQEIRQDPDEYWYVPIAMATKNHPDFSSSNWQPLFWIDKYTLSTTHTVENSTEQWVIVNPDARSYFRVLYDNHFTSLIQNQLEEDHNVLSVSTRSQLIDDYFKSAFHGYVGLNLALNFTQYLHNEEDNAVWTTVFNNLRQPYRQMIDNSAFEDLKAYLSSKIIPVLDKIGWEQVNTDMPVTIILRSQLLDWASSLGATNLIPVSDQYHQSLADGNLIPADIQPAIFCKIIERADSFPPPGFNIREYLLNGYKTATRDERRNVFINALACESNSAQVENLIDLALTTAVGTDFTVGHAVQLLQRLAENPNNREKILDIFILRVTELINNLGESATSSIISTLASYTSNDALTADIKGRITALLGMINSGAVRASLEASAARLDGNKVWDQNHGMTIRNWLNTLSP